MTSYLITGASRGVGFELTKQLSSRADVSIVIAAIRSEPSPQLASVIAESEGKVVSVRCDVSSSESVEQATGPIDTALEGQGLDVLINNAGTSETGGTNWKGERPAARGTSNKKTIEALSCERFLDIFNMNVLGAHRVTASLIPLLRKGKEKKVVNITSTLGSIGLAPQYRLAPQPAYKTTKAALNMLTTQYALDFEDEGFTFVALSPGWLQTDLSEAAGGGADLPVETGARACIDQILAVGPEGTGQFLNIHVSGWEDVPGPNKYDGRAPPW